MVFGSGDSTANLRKIRQFFLVYLALLNPRRVGEEGGTRTPGCENGLRFSSIRIDCTPVFPGTHSDSNIIRIVVKFCAPLPTALSI